MNLGTEFSSARERQNPMSGSHSNFVHAENEFFTLSVSICAEVRPYSCTSSEVPLESVIERVVAPSTLHEFRVAKMHRCYKMQLEVSKICTNSVLDRSDLVKYFVTKENVTI